MISTILEQILILVLLRQYVDESCALWRSIDGGLLWAELT